MVEIEIEEALTNNRRVWGIRLARLLRLRDRLGPRYRQSEHDTALVGAIVTQETVDAEIRIARRNLGAPKGGAP